MWGCQDCQGATSDYSTPPQSLEVLEYEYLIHDIYTCTKNGVVMDRYSGS